MLGESGPRFCERGGGGGRAVVAGSWILHPAKAWHPPPSPTVGFLTCSSLVDLAASDLARRSRTNLLFAAWRQTFS